MSEADASTSSGPRARTRNSPGVAADAARLFVIAATMWKACRREIESMFVGCRNTPSKSAGAQEKDRSHSKAEAVNGRESKIKCPQKTLQPGRFGTTDSISSLSARHAVQRSRSRTDSPLALRLSPLLRSAQHEQVRVACGVGIRRTTVREGGATRSE